MKRVKTLLFSTCISSFAIPAVFALPTTATDTKSHSKLNIVELAAQTQKLEAQVKALQAEVVELKQHESTHAQPVAVKQKSQKTQPSKEMKPIKTFEIGTPVFTAPYMGGINSRYDMSNLIINTSEVNRNVVLLEQEQKALQVLKKHNLKPPSTPVMSFSGEVEGIGQIVKPSSARSTSDIDLSIAKLDTLATLSPWSMAFLSLAYDNQPLASGARINNSRIYIQNGFITIGNLQKAPVYGTLGQLQVPFGRYNSNMITDPLTKYIGITNERAVVLGYRQNGPSSFYAAGFGAKSDAEVGGGNKINQWGADLGYKYSGEKWVANIGASYIAQIADSQGMQATGAGGTDGTNFQGFDSSLGNDNLNHRVGAADVYGELGYGAFDFNAEYVTALTQFAQANMTFNGHGAKPRAGHVEGAYNFDIASLASSVAVSYGRSWESMAVNIPQQRYMATWSLSPWRNTVLSLELRHDIAYGTGTVATGQGGAVVPSDTPGRSSNAVTAQVAVYF